jgi:hypothetical protein
MEKLWLKVSQLLLPVVETEESVKKNYLLDSINSNTETMELVEKLISKLSSDSNV